MEEILASIRRIIADDDATKPPPKASEPATPPRPEPPRLAPAPLPPRPVAPPPRVAPPATNEPKYPEPKYTETKPTELEVALSQLQAKSAPADEPAADILDLTESMTEAPEPAPSFRTIDGQSDVVFEERTPPEPPPAPVLRPPEEPPRHPVRNDLSLMSATTSAVVDSAFNSLAQTVLVQNGRTLEDLVREMLRPMLKTWLDDNLPNMVERLVRAEIERVSRGRG
jgi:cell pole-organizing protein PopZ